MENGILVEHADSMNLHRNRRAQSIDLCRYQSLDRVCASLSLSLSLCTKPSGPAATVIGQPDMLAVSLGGGENLQPARRTSFVSPPRRQPSPSPPPPAPPRRGTEDSHT